VPGAVSSAIPYAIKNGASIFNLSFAIPRLPDVYFTVRNEGKQVLFVAAAGNGRNNAGIDITDEQQRYLNILHQDFPDNFITVAAQDQSGGLACFSNFSLKLVDLAAPGLEIESTVGSGMTLGLSGTSQAAPYVTLTAALLRALGITEPGEIKDRIIASTDFVPALKGKVGSAGKLNLAKAISLQDDMIEVVEVVSETNQPTRKILFGKITSPSDFQIPPIPIPKADIRKITFHYDDADRTIRRVYYMGMDPSTGKRKMVSYVGPFDLESIEFLVNGESTPRTYSPDQIIDVVTARP
jgi:subtilisin family serine protease